jgi:hypothetical protein
MLYFFNFNLLNILHVYGHLSNNKTNKDTRMKKLTLALAAFSAFGVASTAQAAKVDICVFDLLGKSGESYQMAQEWALAAKGWGAEINLIPRQDEAVADNDFKAGKCDGVFMTAMRARQYNKFVGSIDALGGAPSNAIAQRAITFALDQRNATKMVTNLSGKKYEVAGIAPLGSAFIFVRDKTAIFLPAAFATVLMLRSFTNKKASPTGITPATSYLPLTICLAKVGLAKPCITLTAKLRSGIAPIASSEPVNELN